MTRPSTSVTPYSIATSVVISVAPERSMIFGSAAPLVNAHLLDNYLTDPTLTTPGVPVNPLTAHLLYRDTQAEAVAPKTTPVLRQVRAALRELKQGLIDGH